MCKDLKALYSKSNFRGSQYLLPITSFTNSKALKDVTFKRALEQDDKFFGYPSILKSPGIYKYLMANAMLVDLNEVFVKDLGRLETPLKLLSVIVESAEDDDKEAFEDAKRLSNNITQTSRIDKPFINKLAIMQELMQVLTTIVAYTESSFESDIMLHIEEYLEASKYAHDSPTAKEDLEKSEARLRTVFPDMKEEETGDGRTVQDALTALGGTKLQSLKEKELEEIIPSQTVEEEIKYSLDPANIRRVADRIRAEDKLKRKQSPDLLTEGQEDAELIQTLDNTVIDLEPNNSSPLLTARPKAEGSEISHEEYNQLLLELTKMKDKYYEAIQQLNEEAVNASIYDQMKIKESVLKEEKQILENRLDSYAKQLNNAKDRIDTVKGFYSPEDYKKVTDTVKKQEEYIRNAHIQLNKLKEYIGHLESELQSLENEIANTPETSAWVHAQRAVQRVFRKWGGTE